MARAKSTDRPAEPRVALGMGLRLVSALALALMFAGVKWAGQRGAGVAETLFYRQIGGIGSLQELVYELRGTPVQIGKVRSIGNENSRFGDLAQIVDCR